MEQFCKRWFDRYLPRMESYEGPEMVEISSELAGHESNIVPVFHDESTFKISTRVGGIVTWRIMSKYETQESWGGIHDF